MLCNALLLQSLENQFWFEATYALPVNVKVYMAGDVPVWPDTVVVEQFPAYSGEDLGQYVARLDRMLVAHAETETARITKKGDRVSMAYMQKYAEAKAFLEFGTPEVRTLALEDPYAFPYIREHAEAKGLTDIAAAEEIVAKGVLWNVLSAKIEGDRERFQNDVRQAANLVDVDVVYGKYKRSITARVDLLLTPPPVEDSFISEAGSSVDD